MVEDIKGMLERRLRVDERAAAALRVMLGLLIVSDTLLRSRNLVYFYTKSGVLPMGMYEEVAEGVSLLFILPDSTAFVVLFFVIRLLVGLQLLVGYRTRVAVVLSFLLTVSLDMRNPFVLSYSDNMFRILLFWGMFLPLGERWSIDAVVHDDDRGLPELLVRVAGFFALTQIVAVYFINGVQKLQMSGWLTGEKVVDLANSSEMTYLLGVYLHHLPEQVLQATGAAWVYLLLASPLLLLLSGKYRTAFALFFVAGHFFILFTFRVGAFSLVAISALILFVDRDTWGNIESDLVATLRPEGFVRVVKRVIPERGRDLSEASHNVLVVLAAVLLLVSGVSMVSANIDTVAESRGAGDIYDEPSLLGAVQDTKEMFGVHQPEWTIMTDAPQVDRYFVFAGQTSGGATKDLYNDRVLSFERPYEDLTHQYETYRERFYMYNMIRVVEGPDTPGMLGMGISEYLCGIRREGDGERLEEVSIYLIFQERDSKKRMGASLYHHTCGGKHPPEPVGYPPTENISVDGLEPIVVDKPLTASFASGIENMSRNLSFDGKADDLNLQMCKRKPKPFVFEKLQEHTRRHEVRNPVSGIENVTGVKTEILRKQRNTNALALRHGMTVHTQQRAVDNPIIYVADYIITDSFIYRRVLSTEKTQIPTSLLRKNQGFVRCFF
jgi:hypothetical protein